MTDYTKELGRALASNHIKKIAQAAEHVDKETVLKCLRFAVFEHRNSAVIEELVKHADKRNLSSVLLVALHRNHLEAFDVVWNYVVPNEDQEQVLREAVLRGHIGCVRKLLAQNDVDDYLGGKLLAHACHNQNSEMVDVLYGVCNPQTALDHLNSQNLPKKYSKLIVQRMEQEQLRAHLSDVTGLNTKPAGGRKL